MLPYFWKTSNNPGLSLIKQIKVKTEKLPTRKYHNLHNTILGKDLFTIDEIYITARLNFSQSHFSLRFWLDSHLHEDFDDIQKKYNLASYPYLIHAEYDKDRKCGFFTFADKIGKTRTLVSSGGEFIRFFDGTLNSLDPINELAWAIWDIRNAVCAKLIAIEMDRFSAENMFKSFSPAPPQ